MAKPGSKSAARRNASSAAVAGGTDKTAMRRSPAYWLIKSEPDVFSWSQLVAKGSKGEEWNGVRNYLARNNMREMQLGDLCFFYHSNIGKEIVGIAEVAALAHPDSTDATGTWECVDVRAVCALAHPVSLVEIKAKPELADMSLVKSMRLSVQPVTPDEWAIIVKMGGLDPKSIHEATSSGTKRAPAAKRR